MFIEPVGLEVTELYAPEPPRKKPKTDKYTIYPGSKKSRVYSRIKSRIKRFRKKP